MKKSLLILSMIIGCISVSVLFKVTLVYGFMAAIMITLLITRNKVSSVRFGITELYKCKNVFLIILLLGANIALWMSSGILPTLVFYSTSFIGDVNFLLTTFLVTAVVSTVMGTGLGTFSTIGIVFLTLSNPLGYPTPVVVGCLVSGAFVADKISPVAALTNLTMEITKVTYSDYFKSVLKTLLPTVLITGLIYFFLNQSYAGDAVLSLDVFKTVLPEWFNVSLLTLLIPVGMMVLSVVGIPVIHNMLIVFISSSLVTIFYQQHTISSWVNTVLKGFELKSLQQTPDDAFLISIFKGGGMLPMVEVLIIVACAVFLTGLLMSEKHLDPVIKQLMKGTDTPFKLILKTGILSAFLTTLTCDQTVGITVPGEVLQKDYKRMGLNNDVLARTISDTGTIIAPLEFWNVNALIITGLTGVSAVAYAPFAFLCFVSPLVTLGYAKMKLDKRSKKV